MALPTLDVVIPLYNEIEVVDLLHRRVMAVCRKTGFSFTIIYVDDGSRDGTPDWIKQNAMRHDDERREKVSGSFFATPFAKATPQCEVRLLQLSRNFGQPAAIFAGLKHSQADCTVVMDGDLQDPPELIAEMTEAWKQGEQVVIAQRRSRKETFLRGLAFRTFHYWFRYLADTDIPANTGTFCLLDRSAANAMVDLPESHRFFPGLRSWLGFRQTSILFDREQRAGGTPKQSFIRLFKYALDAIFGFSLKPLRLLTSVGAMICVASLLLASWFLTKRIMGWETASIGFTTLMCAVLGLGGFQLVGLGILGEYVGRIYDEVKGRPQFVVAEEFRGQSVLQESSVQSVREMVA